jgi:hypothetical protein
MSQQGKIQNTVESVGIEFRHGTPVLEEETMNEMKMCGRTLRTPDRRMKTTIVSRKDATFFPPSIEHLNSVHEESENNSFSIDNDDDQFGKMFMKMNSQLLTDPSPNLSKRKKSEQNWDAEGKSGTESSMSKRQTMKIGGQIPVMRKAKHNRSMVVPRSKFLSQE